LLAVSGGPDSTALMHLVARLRRYDVLVATVDHGLRPEARAEADAVGAQAAALGLSHHILAWEGPKPRAGLQERAREARSALLLACAREEGAARILTGHTLDDQAETVLMRLAWGSGIGGLGAMRSVTFLGDVALCRPFLPVAKARLVATCRTEEWPFASDPSNADPRFARPRLRRLQAVLAREGLTPRRLATLARRAQQAEDALQAQVDEVLAGAELLVIPGLSEAENPEPSAVFVHPRVPGSPAAPRNDGEDASQRSRPFAQAAPLPTPPISVATDGREVLIAGRPQGAQVSLDGAHLVRLPDAVLLRVVARFIAAVAGREPPRLERLERLVLNGLRPALAAGRAWRATLGGALLAFDGLCLTVVPEPLRRRGHRVADAAAPPHSLGNVPARA
jgi:tRNA(Ile)-lysidine synthetase-like protein